MYAYIRLLCTYLYIYVRVIRFYPYLEGFDRVLIRVIRLRIRFHTCYIRIRKYSRVFSYVLISFNTF